MLWGPLSDRYGRRPVFLVCLTILIGACIGIAVIPTDAFWLLIVLRCLQAAGCASTIALGINSFFSSSHCMCGANQLNIRCGCHRRHLDSRREGRILWHIQSGPYGTFSQLLELCEGYFTLPYHGTNTISFHPVSLRRLVVHFLINLDGAPFSGSRSSWLFAAFSSSFCKFRLAS